MKARPATLLFVAVLGLAGCGGVTGGIEDQVPNPFKQMPEGHLDPDLTVERNP